MDRPSIDSVASLLAHAHRMEEEAARRYDRLADKMAQAGGDEVAQFFRTMAEIERHHADQVTDMAEALELPPLDAEQIGGPAGSGPETPGTGALPTQTMRDAILEAMQSEEAAAAFFEAVGARTRDRGVRRLATDLATEERHHVSLLRNWLSRLGAD